MGARLVLVSRWLLAALFVAAGVNHFVAADFYLSMMPPWLPWHGPLVAISGVAEIVGGLGILVPRTRRLAGLGLVALLIAVFPANIHVAVNAIPPPGTDISQMVLYVRLLFQPPLILWVWWACVRDHDGVKVDVEPHGSAQQRKPVE